MDKRDNLKPMLEALIFASDKPVSARKLAEAAGDASPDEAEECLRELTAEWEAMKRGFRLVQVADGYQFRTLPDFADAILKLKQSKPFRLGRAAMEALSIIAYKQPVTRIEIDQIRGVDSSGVVGALLERRLIQIKGRRDVIGKPFLYGTTDEFLETFGMRNLGDLHTLKEFEEIEKSIAQES